MTTEVLIRNINGPEPIKVMVITLDGTCVNERIVYPGDEYTDYLHDMQSIALSEYVSCGVILRD